MLSNSLKLLLFLPIIAHADYTFKAKPAGRIEIVTFTIYDNTIKKSDKRISFYMREVTTDEDSVEYMVDCSNYMYQSKLDNSASWETAQEKFAAPGTIVRTAIKYTCSK